MREKTLKGSNKIKVHIQSSWGLVSGSVFDGGNLLFAETRNGMKHAEHDGIETARCYCDVSRWLWAMITYGLGLPPCSLTR